MFSLVVSKQVRVKAGGLSLHYRIIPLTIGHILAAEGHSDRWLYNSLTRPEGLVAALFKPFLAHKLAIECQDQVKASMPDDEGGGDKKAPTAEDMRGYAEFLPRLCYYYKWTIDDALALTIRDAVWFMRAGNFFEMQESELKIKLAGGQVNNPVELKLDSRFNKIKGGKVDGERFASLQLALRQQGGTGDARK